MLVLVVAIDLVGAGPTEVGLLTSAAGLGGIIGAAAAVALVGRARLAGPFALGLLVWGVPVAILGVVPGLVDRAGDVPRRRRRARRRSTSPGGRCSSG